MMIVINCQLVGLHERERGANLTQTYVEVVTFTIPPVCV